MYIYIQYMMITCALYTWTIHTAKQDQIGRWNGGTVCDPFALENDQHECQTSQKEQKDRNIQKWCEMGQSCPYCNIKIGTGVSDGLQGIPQFDIQNFVPLGETVLHGKNPLPFWLRCSSSGVCQQHGQSPGDFMALEMAGRSRYIPRLRPSVAVAINLTKSPKS